MMGWKTSIVIGAIACTAFLTGCNSSPSAPDIDTMIPTTSASETGSSLAVGESVRNRGDGALGVVYVTSQDLYYDTFVTAKKLPPHGPFQLLENGRTEWGPGDKNYVGGRWKVSDGDGGFRYFLCPLLGPGRTSP